MNVPASQILGVLLSGGRSQRMGGADKCLASLAGRPLLSHSLDRLRPQVSALVLNANGPTERFAGFGLPVVTDTIPGFAGPLAGFLAGMLWAQNHMPSARFIATVATDTPFFPLDLVRRLSAALDSDHEVAIARCDDQNYPVFGLFPVSLADALESFLTESDNRAVMAWLDSQRAAFVDFSPELKCQTTPFFNINAPADLAAAELTVRAKNAQPSDC